MAVDSTDPAFVTGAVGVHIAMLHCITIGLSARTNKKHCRVVISLFKQNLVRCKNIEPVIQKVTSIA
jgi:hypothetical protein